MEITRTSSLTGVTRTVDIPVTQEQLDRIAGKETYIQNICPELTPAQREFLMTGITDDEWADAFGPEE